MRPSTASPRNSRRSFDRESSFSAHHDRWAIAVDSNDGSVNCRPSRSARASSCSAFDRVRAPSAAGAASGRRPWLRGLELGDDVVDGVANRLQVLEVLVVDAEPHGALAELLLQRLDELDEGERVGGEVLSERGALGDGGGVDLENVGQAVADELEHLLAIHGRPFHVGLGGHRSRMIPTSTPDPLGAMPANQPNWPKSAVTKTV